MPKCIWQLGDGHAQHHEQGAPDLRIGDGAEQDELVGDGGDEGLHGDEDEPDGRRDEGEAVEVGVVADDVDQRGRDERERGEQGSTRERGNLTFGGTGRKGLYFACSMGPCRI